ncbi:MAG TPA: zf-HC2 domain-containing protein [Polyangiaceae bacterium]|nr:zf-HC2 domain-containing protein [Polyangiaceae bacterium]
MSCRAIQALLDAYVDGELVAEQTLEVEEHLATCESCGERARFGAALKESTRKVVSADAVPSAGFESRLASALRAERERVLAPAARISSRAPARKRWAKVAPMLLAAASTFAVVTWLNARADRERSVAALASVMPPVHVAPVETPEQVLDELVDYHTAPPAPQITEPNLVPKLEPEVGVPVKLPLLKQYGASWEGGAVVPMQNQRAAIFRYRLSNHPVTVYVYDAHRVPLRGVLEPRVVHNQAVSVGERRGYSIAAREQRGVGYAIATDLNDDESAELVSTIY